MSKQDQYRAQLRSLDEWDPYLLANSGLPGPRANLELVQAVADEGNPAQFRRWLAMSPDATPPGTALEFLPVCGAVGLGRLLASGERSALAELRPLADDPRWRVREGVAMALQRWGDADMPALLGAMPDWSQGSRWEQRAAVAALCEPQLLREADAAGQVLALLDGITRGIAATGDRRDESFRVLRQALGYGWSVAVVALPDAGRPLMEGWFASPDRDVRWIMRENLRKDRLRRMDAAWTARWQGALGVI